MQRYVIVFQNSHLKMISEKKIIKVINWLNILWMKASSPDKVHHKMFQMRHEILWMRSGHGQFKEEFPRLPIRNFSEKNWKLRRKNGNNPETSGTGNSGFWDIFPGCSEIRVVDFFEKMENLMQDRWYRGKECRIILKWVGDKISLFLLVVWGDNL